jgi:hypothetical protein
MSSSLTRVDAPVVVRDPVQEVWRDPDWQRLWLSIQGRSWSTLAVVPAALGGPADFSLSIAVTLARIGIMHLGVPIQVADARSIPLVHLMQFIQELQRLKADGDLVLIALAPMAQNPITLQIAQAADSAVLCVLLEEMSSSEAKGTVDKIGTSRFLGSAVFNLEKGVARPAHGKP